MGATQLKGWNLPALADEENPTVGDLFEWVSSADEVLFPRFTDIAQRTSRHSSPVNGQVCFVEETGEFYKYSDRGWISLFPRRFVLSSNVTLADGTTPQELFQIPLESDSTYVVLGYFRFTVPGDDLELVWTFDDPILEGEWSIGVDDAATYDIETTATITASDNVEMYERIRACYIKTLDSTTATLSALKDADSGADGTVFATSTYVELWLVDNHEGEYGYPSTETGVAVAALGALSATAFGTGGTGGGLAEGERAGPGLVGYLGDPDDLIVLNAGGDLTGTDFEGVAEWDTGNLLVTSGGVTAEGYYINGPVVHTGGTDFTIRNCIIDAPGGVGFWGISANGDTRGTLTVEDCTVICGTSGTDTYSNGISSDARLVARRNDVSGSGDGIHCCGIVGSLATGSIVSQNWIHDLSFLDSEQHLDGIQVFNTIASNTTTDTFVTIEHNYVEGVLGPVGEPINAALTCGKPPSEDNGPYLTPLIDNNYFEAGIYHLRIGYRILDAVVTDNNLGEVTGDEVGLVSVDVSGSVDTWTNNRDGSGPAGSGDIVDNPNP